MIPPTGLQIYLRPHVTLTFDLWPPDPKVDRSMPFGPVLLVPIDINFVFKLSCSRIWYEMNGRTDERTDRLRTLCLRLAVWPCGVTERDNRLTTANDNRLFVRRVEWCYNLYCPGFIWFYEDLTIFEKFTWWNNVCKFRFVIWFFLNFYLNVLTTIIIIINLLQLNNLSVVVVALSRPVTYCGLLSLTPAGRSPSVSVQHLDVTWAAP